jgi:hypothetical protein
MTTPSFTVVRLTHLPGPKMALKSVEVPTLRIGHVNPVVTLVLLSAKSKHVYCSHKSISGKQTILQLITIELASTRSCIL